MVAPNAFSSKEKIGDQTFLSICVSLLRKKIVNTFWRPHFSIWRLKKTFQSPVGACLKKLISDPVSDTADTRKIKGKLRENILTNHPFLP